MKNKNTLQIWLAQTRANFLILAVLLTFIGISATLKYPGMHNGLNWIHATLLVFAMISAHISVNLFNEYSDYKTRIDFNTFRTPFNGGSGMLTSGNTSPKQVLFAAICTLIFSTMIGFYFVFTAHLSILLIMLLGGFTIVFYTNFLAKYALGEFFSGLTLGSLVVIGTYIALTAVPGQSFRTLIPEPVFWISIPPGILTSLLLFINEIPDMEADKKGGRRHLVILMGRRKSSWIYTLGVVLTYMVVLLMPLINLTSWWVSITFLTLPFAWKAVSIALKHYNNNQQLIPALGSNVIMVLGTDLLLGLGLLIG